MKDLTNQKFLKEMLNYNLETGIFTWIKKPSKKIMVGDKAGRKYMSGYIRIKLFGKSYSAHRLAWIYMNGSINKEMIDHINGIKDDNRLCNLREVTRSENLRNSKRNIKNTSGYPGVSFDKKYKKWRVQVIIDNFRKHIGYFDDLEFAGLVSLEFRDKYYGEYVRK